MNDLAESILKDEIDRLRTELDQARADIARKDAALCCSLDYQHAIDRKMIPGLGDSPLTAMIHSALSPLPDEGKAA